MTAPHRATPEQWQEVENWVERRLLELTDRIAALEAAATSPPARDHFPGAAEMVATDEELVKAFRVCSSLRDIYNLGRQHGAQPRQEGEPAKLPPNGYAYRYRSTRGETVIRFNYGQEVDGSRPIEAVPYWLGKPPIDLRTPASHPTPPPAPAGGLVERVAEAYGFSSWKGEARAAIHAVAAWLDTKGQHGCSFWLREEVERHG